MPVRAETIVFLDNHSTTRCDPRVAAEVQRYLVEEYGNAGSRTHMLGHRARDVVEASRQSIAKSLNCSATEIVFTSGATESNNLALRGLSEHPRRKRHHIVTVSTEHRAVLDPIRSLEAKGMRVTILPVRPQEDLEAGRLNLQQLEEVIGDETLVVSVMMANNEIGVIQLMEKIGRLCRERNVYLHCDATQAMGKVAMDVEALHVDLLSFSAHKFYGPKGVGGLYVRRRGNGPRLAPQQDGGGQEFGLRSGTLNVAGIAGMALALELSLAELPQEQQRLRFLRSRLYQGLCGNIHGVELNGPDLDLPGLRLDNNLNLAFEGVSGETLMLELPDLAMSSGSACSSANPEPSHVLRSLGLNDDRVRSSLRFGLGRFNTEAEIDYAVDRLVAVVRALRQ